MINTCTIWRMKGIIVGSADCCWFSFHWSVFALSYKLIELFIIIRTLPRPVVMILKFTTLRTSRCYRCPPNNWILIFHKLRLYVITKSIVTSYLIFFKIKTSTTTTLENSFSIVWVWGTKYCFFDSITIVLVLLKRENVLNRVTSVLSVTWCTYGDAFPSHGVQHP